MPLRKLPGLLSGAILAALDRLHQDHCLPSKIRSIAIVSHKTKFGLGSPAKADARITRRSTGVSNSFNAVSSSSSWKSRSIPRHAYSCNSGNPSLSPMLLNPAPQDPTFP